MHAETRMSLFFLRVYAKNLPRIKQCLLRLGRPASTLKYSCNDSERKKKKKEYLGES